MTKIKIIFFTILLQATCVIAQNSNFEGVISYTISLDGNMPKEVQAMFNGSEAHTYIKGDKRRIDLNMAMQSTSTVVDAKNNTSVTLMDFAGQKYLIRSTSDDIKKEEAAMPDFTYNYTDDTKTIAGYKCKKVAVTAKINGKDETFNVYVTDEIPSTDIKSTYKGLKGFPLEYSMSQSGLKITFTAKNVSKDKVSDSKFDIPKEGYKEFNMEEFKKEMMKYGAQ